MHFLTFTGQDSNLKRLTLKNLGQGHGIQHSYGPIRWQMSTSIKVTLAHFLLANHHFQDIHISSL